MQRATISDDFGETSAIIKCEIDDNILDIDDTIDKIPSIMAVGGINSGNNNNFGSNTEILDCVVCGDRATGT